MNPKKSLFNPNLPIKDVFAVTLLHDSKNSDPENGLLVIENSENEIRKLQVIGVEVDENSKATFIKKNYTEEEFLTYIKQKNCYAYSQCFFDEEAKNFQEVLKKAQKKIEDNEYTFVRRKRPGFFESSLPKSPDQTIEKYSGYDWARVLLNESRKSADVPESIQKFKSKKISVHVGNLGQTNSIVNTFGKVLLSLLNVTAAIFLAWHLNIVVELTFAFLTAAIVSTARRQSSEASPPHPSPT